MSAVPATKLPTVVTEPITALETLLSDRAGLTRELAGLQASSARLRETATAEAGIIAEIGNVGRDEIAAMVAWASGGCVGDQPAPDQRQRRALAEKLSAAQSAATAAKAAGADIDTQISRVSEQLAINSRNLDQAIFDLLETEHGDIISQYRAVCEHGSKLAAQIHGLATYYGEAGRTLIGRGEQDAGGNYLQRASALTNIKLPNPGVTRLEIEAAASDWGRRAATLRSGK
jgi:hypothetical protein